jgi:hypothetical protein
MRMTNPKEREHLTAIKLTIAVKRMSRARIARCELPGRELPGCASDFRAYPHAPAVGPDVTAYKTRRQSGCSKSLTLRTAVYGPVRTVV